MKKKLIGTILVALFATASLSVMGQEKKENVGQKIENTATKVGNKTAEVAVKGASKVADKTWKGKMAPNGSDVFIDNKNRKYYINKKGGKVYLKASEIRNKPEN